MKFISLWLILTLTAHASGTSPKTQTLPDPENLTVIATTDFHGALEPEDVRTEGGAELTIGGAAVFASYLKILKKNVKGPVIWVDGGDLFQGSMASNLFEGAPVVRMFNSLGLQAAALGNHEFDYGPEGEKAVPRDPRDDPRGALKKRISEAKFPVLAANVKTDQGVRPEWLKASVVLETQGLRVGVVGVASPGTPGSTNALNLKGLVFEAAAPAVKAEAERLRREERVDAVIAVGHFGALCDDNDLDKQEDLSSCKPNDDEAFQLANSLPAGLVNMIVAGHTHRGVAKRVNGVTVLQSFSNGRYIGWASLPLKGKEPPRVEGLVPVCTKVVETIRGPSCDPYLMKGVKSEPVAATFFGEKITADKTITKLLAPELNQVKARKDAPLGFSAIDRILRAYAQESALGNFMADLTKEAVTDADLGLANGGGLRANFNPGPITYGDLFSVLPFDNQIATINVSGKLLTEIVQFGFSGSGGILSWSDNLRLSADGCVLKELTVNGQAVDPKKIYKIATTDYLAGGGSGMKNLNIPEKDITIFWDAAYILRDQLANVLKKRKGDIRSADFYQPENPRQKFNGACKPSASFFQAIWKEEAEHGHRH